MGLGIHEGHIHLQRGIGQGTQQLQLRVLLYRHIIQDQYLQWTHILMYSTELIHDEYIFVLQYFFGRQIILCLNRHFIFLRVNFIPRKECYKSSGNLLP